MPSPNILLTDDLSNFSPRGRQRSHQLRNLAANLCVALGAHLHFLYVEDVPERLRQGRKLLPLDKRNPQMVDQLKKELRKLTVDFEVRTDLGSPLEKILTYAEKIHPEFIIIGTRGKHGLGNFLLGSVAEEVVRHSSVPVIVVGPKSKNLGFTVTGKKNRILLLTDLTRASKDAEDFAIKLAKKTKSRVTVFHSVGDSIKHAKDVSYRSRIPNMSLEDQTKDLKRWARTEIAKRFEQFKKEGLTVQTHLVKEEREVEKDIQRELEEGYDLIVMGTHTRGKILTSFLGSTARHTCLFSSAPVAIVRSK